jgi:hypothetical protein
MRAFTAIEIGRRILLAIRYRFRSKIGGRLVLGCRRALIDADFDIKHAGLPCLLAENSLQLA